MKIQCVVSGGKYVDPETGFRYWWPDEDAPASTEPLGPEWQDVGYTTEAGA